MPTQHENNQAWYKRLNVKVKAVDAILQFVPNAQQDLRDSRALHGADTSKSKVGAQLAHRADAIQVARQAKLMNSALKAAGESLSKKTNNLLVKALPAPSKDNIIEALWAIRIFDAFEKANVADAHRMMLDPNVLRIITTAPVKPSNVPAVEIDRAVKDHIESTYPADTAALDAEGKALQIGADALNGLHGEMRTGLDMLENEFSKWVAEQVPEPSKQELAAVSREVADTSVAQLIEHANALPYGDRTKLLDAILSGQGDDLAARERDLKSAA